LPKNPQQTDRPPVFTVKEGSSSPQSEAPMLPRRRPSNLPAPTHLETGLPTDFDPAVYIGLYEDLQRETKSLNEEQKITFAKWHYLHHGKEEKRRYHAVSALPTDFDPAVYIGLYEDLQRETKSLNEEQKITFAKWHYLHHGKEEKRPYH
jgi:hypothetical protein